MSQETTPASRSAEGGGPDLGIVARLGAQKSKFKAAAAALTTQRDALKTENDRLLAENAELRTKGDTSAQARRVAELEGRLRTITHRQVFDRLAKAKGANANALDDLYQLSGYKAEADEADETALATLIDEQKTARGYLFDQPASTTTTTTTATATATTKPPLKPGPASGQGRRETGAPVVMDESRHGDVKYVFSHFDSIAAAAKERVDRGEI